jgi:hypothetical protein
MGSAVVHGSIAGAPREATGSTVGSLERSPRNVGQWAMAGAAIGFGVVAVVIGVVAFFWGLDAGGSLGLGLYVGGFGGAGFGFMMGGMLALPAEGQPSHQ